MSYLFEMKRHRAIRTRCDRWSAHYIIEEVVDLGMNDEVMRCDERNGAMRAMMVSLG